MRFALKHDVELSQNVQTCRAANGPVEHTCERLQEPKEA